MFTTLAAAHDVKVRFSVTAITSGYARGLRREMVCTPLISEEARATAYHELGHIVRFDPKIRRHGDQRISPAAELSAWNWARAQLGPEWTDRMAAQARRCLATYVPYADTTERAGFAEWGVTPAPDARTTAYFERYLTLKGIL